MEVSVTMPYRISGIEAVIPITDETVLIAVVGRGIALLLHGRNHHRAGGRRIGNGRAADTAKNIDPVMAYGPGRHDKADQRPRSSIKRRAMPPLLVTSTKIKNGINSGSCYPTNRLLNHDRERNIREHRHDQRRHSQTKRDGQADHNRH